MSQLWTRFAGLKRPARKPSEVVVETVVEVNDRTTGAGQLQWEFSAGWLQGAGHGGAYLGNDTYSLTPGATATLRFTGTRALIRSAYGTAHGIISARLNNGTAIQIDLYGARLEDQIVYDTGILANGQHTVVMTCTGLKRAAATDVYVVIDRATVTSTLGGTSTYGSAVLSTSRFG